MLTRKEWFNTVADKTIRDGLFRNGENLDEVEVSLQDAIDMSFTWSNSLEGSLYWMRVSDMEELGTLKLRKPLYYDL